MNNTTLNYTTKLKANPHSPSPQPNEADFLTVSFSPTLNLLCAHWLKPVNSGEYRQAVRMIARSIAFLRAELVLINVAAQFTISPQDQQWTASFLREALAKSSIKRSARVIPASEYQIEAIQQVMAKTGTLPYQVGIFHQVEAARDWLLDGYPQELNTDGEIQIPLNFNLKLLRREVLRKQNEATKPKQEENCLTPAVLPDLIEVKTDFVGITISKPESLMSIRWKKPPVSRQYRFGMLKAGRALMEHRLERVLLNNQRLGVLTLEDQSWLVNTSIDLLPKTNIRKLAVVTSADALQQMSSEAIGCRLREANLPYEARYFMSEEEAREWLMLEHTEG